MAGAAVSVQCGMVSGSMRCAAGCIGGVYPGCIGGVYRGVYIAGPLHRLARMAKSGLNTALIHRTV